MEIMIQKTKYIIKQVLKFFIRGKLRVSLRVSYNKFIDKGTVFYIKSFYLFNFILIFRYKESTCGKIKKYYIGPFLVLKKRVSHD